MSRISQHYIFGYGSLLCPKSRAITAPSLASTPALPILARHVQRTWTARGGTMTYVGVQKKEGATCAGVLVPVNHDELQRFDVREAGYDRIRLTTEQLERVPFLTYKDQKHHDDVLSSNSVSVWVYVQKVPIPANPSFPICQSYVDIILRGCLSISPEFAASFLETTDGWHHEEHETWVDDRHCPLYERADPRYSRRMASRIDELLQKHVRHAWQKRQLLQ